MISKVKIMWLFFYYLNSIGNLTLTGYNSKYSNRSFDRKLNIEKGFKDSLFSFLNRLSADKTNWGKKKLSSVEI